MSLGAQRAANPKLPLWDTICSSYSTYFNHITDVLRISWLWLAIAVLSAGVQRFWIGNAVAVVQPGARPHVPAGPSALESLCNFLLLLGIVSIAVAWHRRMILNELTWFSAGNVFTKSFWRYIGVAILISLVAVLPVLLLFFIVLILVHPFSSSGGSGHPALAALILVPASIALYVTSMAVILRLSLLLPARAVGDFGRTFKEAWRQTRGNTWRMFWGLLACSLPVTIIIQIVMWRVVGLPTPQMTADGTFAARLGLINAVFMFCYLLTWPIAIGFLSLSYHFFFQRDQVGVFD
jgi:hypothetical protein